jgi:amino acid transporter
VESAFPIVAMRAGGHMLFVLLNFTILVANIGSGMGAQLAAARLLYGMGRGNALPKKVFGVIDAKTRIPRNNVLIIGAIALTGSFLLSFERGAELLNFGAFIAFMGVNAAAFVRYYLKERGGISNLLVPVFGFIICAFIWWYLSTPAKIVGAIWLAVGVIYGAIRTKGFRSDLVQFETPSED